MLTKRHCERSEAISRLDCFAALAMTGKHRNDDQINRTSNQPNQPNQQPNQPTNQPTKNSPQKPNSKTMKTLTITLAALILTLSACGLKKSLTRLQTKTSVQEQTITSDSQLQWSTYTRQSTINDSNEHLYKITIFPTDTLFHFSIQEGFKGKANKIEITGLSQHRSYITDTTTTTSLNNKEKQVQLTKKASNKATSVVKTVNKHKNYWVWLVMLGVGVGVCYFLRSSLRA